MSPPASPRRRPVPVGGPLNPSAPPQEAGFQPEPPLHWEIAIPLATNPVMLRAMAVATGGAGLVVGLLVGLLLAVQGEWALAGKMLGLLVLGGAGFFLVALGIMAVIFGNRLRMRFTVSNDGVRCEVVDRTARLGNRAAMWAGWLLGRPAAAGSGLLAMAQEDQTLRWRGAFTARVHPGRRTITLRNRWRALLTVYCDAENFSPVCERVQRSMAAHGTAARSLGPSGLPGYLRDTALVVLASLPALVAGRVYGYGLLLPFVMMCFAVASVWFVRHLAWVTLLCATAVAGAIGVSAVEPRALLTSPGSRLRYEMLTGDQWALTLLCAAGLVALAWHASRLLRRRVLPALEADSNDSAEVSS